MVTVHLLSLGLGETKRRYWEACLLLGIIKALAGFEVRGL